MRLWRLPQGTLLRTHREKEVPRFTTIPPFGLAFARDGSLLASAGILGDARHSATYLWDVTTGEAKGEWDKLPIEVQKPDRLYENPRSLVFTGDGKAVATVSPFGVRVRALPDAKEICLFDPDADPTIPHQYVLAAPTNGPLLAVTSATRERVQLWDYTSKRVLREFKTERQGGKHLALSADGRLLAMGWFPEVAIWDVATGERLGTIRDPGASQPAYAFSPNGRLLATADAYSKVVKVWDVFTRKEVARFEGHEAPTTCVAFSPDGGLLASGSQDTTVLLWDVRKLQSSPPAVALSAEALQNAWGNLSAKDAATGWQAANDLIGAGDLAMAFFKERLKPAAAPDADRLRKLVVDLDANEPRTREAAATELEDLAERAAPSLRTVLEGKPSAEVRASVERLLNALSPLPKGTEQIRQDRALYVLEQLNCKEARALLDRLADGMATARLTVEAKAALERLKRQETARKALPAPPK